MTSVSIVLRYERKDNPEVSQVEKPLSSSRASITSGGFHRLRRKSNLAGLFECRDSWRYFKNMHTLRRLSSFLFSEKPEVLTELCARTKVCSDTTTFVFENNIYS